MYEAGTVVGSFDVPDLVQDIRDQLNEVREGLQKLDQEQYPRGRDYTRPDPIEELRFQQSRDALYKEESRLQEELQVLIWLLPPYMEPPHNITQAKAKKILEHGEVHGQALTQAQRGFFGLIAGGGKPTRLKKG